jgi:hypothetical protein
MASELVAQVERHVRGEDLDRVDALAAQAVVDLLGQLVALAHEQARLGALALGAAFLVFSFGASGSSPRRRASMSSAMIAPDDFASRRALALLGEVEVADGEEEAEDVRVVP